MSSFNNIYPLIQEETIMTHASIRSMALASGLVTLLSVCSVGMQTAKADESAPQMKVSYADLNLSNMQGAEALYRRIKKAAGEVCYPREEKNLALMATRRACIHTAMSDAVTHVGSPTLMAVYNTRDGRSQPLQVALSDNRQRE